MSKQSIKAFIKHVESGKALYDKHLIYRRLKQCGEMSLKDICEQLSMPIQSASGRISELYDMGIISQNIDGKYQLTDFCKIEIVKRFRQTQRIARAKKILENEGFEVILK